MRFLPGVRVSLCGAWLALGATAPVLAQVKDYAPGQAILLVEPDAVQLPPGLSRAPADRVRVAAARLREVFARRRVATVRQMHPSWTPANLPPGFVVRARKKGGVLQPNELTDLSQFYVVEFPAIEPVDTVVADLNAAEGIVYAEPNYYITSTGLRDSHGSRSSRPRLPSRTTRTSRRTGV